MKQTIRKIAFFIYPPFEANKARKYVETNILRKRDNQIDLLEKGIRASLAHKTELGDIEVLAKRVCDSEEARGDHLENKAQVFIASLGFSLSIVAVIPVLFDSNTWRIPKLPTSLVALFLCLSLIHFFVAVHYSFAARKSRGLALPNVDGLLEGFQADKVEAIDRIVDYLVMAKYNEPVLLLKSNSLATAETMFKRGLLFVASASILLVFAKLWVEII